MNIKFIFVLASLLFSLSSFAQESSVNGNDLYNIRFMNEQMTFIPISQTPPENLKNDQSFYMINLVLNQRCTPTSLNLYINNPDMKIAPDNNNNNRARIKIGNRSFSEKIYTFFENSMFFIETPSNIIYSLNFSGDMSLELNFKDDDFYENINFTLSEEERNSIISQVRSCKPS
jgi:hypothetical protein